MTTTATAITATLKRIDSRGFLISTTAAEEGDSFYGADLFTLSQASVDALLMAQKNSGNVTCHRNTGKRLEALDLCIQSQEGYLFISNKGLAVADAIKVTLRS